MKRGLARVEAIADRTMPPCGWPSISLPSTGPNALGARMPRPHVPGRRGQIWVDSMDPTPPFLAALAEATGEERYLDEAVAEFEAYSATLQTPGEARLLASAV